MARLIQTEIKQPLANELLFGRLQNGGRGAGRRVDGDAVTSRLRRGRSGESGEPPVTVAP